MAIVTDGLVLYLHGACGKNNPATRVWKDLSGNGNDGELVNFGYTEDSGWGDGLRFDGVDDYVDCGNINSYSTVELIFKYSSLQEALYPTLLNQNVQSSTGQFIWLYTTGLETTLRLQVGNDGYQVKSILNFIDYDKLVHMVIVFNNDGVLIYKNGHLYENLIFTNGGKAPTTGRLYVGAYQGRPSRIFNGNIDLIRIYNRALTDEEILQNYQAGHEWTPQIGKREATTTMKPITSSLSRKGTGRRELITTVKPITTSLERKGKGTREVISTMKPITASLSRKGVGKREVTTTVKPITSSISKKLPPIHANITAKERNPSITTRERIPKLEVD